MVRNKVYQFKEKARCEMVVKSKKPPPANLRATASIGKRGLEAEARHQLQYARTARRSCGRVGQRTEGGEIGDCASRVECSGVVRNVRGTRHYAASAGGIGVEVES